MSYLHIIPHDIYIHIYKYVYNDCMKDVVRTYKNKRDTKYKDKYLEAILNDNNRLYYTSLEIFNAVSLGITGDLYDNNINNNNTDILDEELYYLSAITEFNFLNYHYNILITTDLPDNLKEATCIRIRLYNIDILLGFDDPNDTDNIIYAPLYYILNDFITTWLELVYYTNKLLNEYLFIHNLATNGVLFELYGFDTVIENGYTVIVPIFEEPT
jgi:hypothetical protein